MRLAPLFKPQGNKLWPIVNSDPLGIPSPFDDSIQTSGDPLSWKGEIDLDT